MTVHYCGALLARTTLPSYQRLPHFTGKLQPRRAYSMWANFFLRRARINNYDPALLFRTRHFKQIKCTRCTRLDIVVSNSSGRFPVHMIKHGSSFFWVCDWLLRSQVCPGQCAVDLKLLVRCHAVVLLRSLVLTTRFLSFQLPAEASRE